MSAHPLRLAHWLALALACPVVLAVLALPALAQEPGGLRIESVDASEHPEVRLSVSAAIPLDVGKASQEGFAVFEDGLRRPVEVQHVGSGRLEVVLLVDTSGSMQGAAINAAREAASTFVQRMPSSVEVALVTFSTDAPLAVPFGAPREQLLAALDGLVASGETALYDAVNAGLAAFPAGTADARRVVVLLSDGGDTTSTGTLDDAVAGLSASGAQLSVIELATAETDRPALERLAAAGSGEILSTTDPAALVALYERLAADLVNRFELRYRSSAAGPTELRVELAQNGRRLVGVGTFDLPEAPAPSLRIGEFLDPGLLASRWAMLAGAAALYVAAALLVLAALAPRAPRPSMISRGRQAEGTPVSGLADWATRAAERGLQRRHLRTGLNEKLENAGIDLRPGEFVVLVVSAAATVGAFGLLLAGPLTGLLLAIGAVVLARVGLDAAVQRRRSRFAEQLGDTLQLLAGSLRAGHSLMQAVDAVSEEAEAPTCEEFRRLVVETRLGRDMETSLAAMAQRMGSEDFEWVAQAIAIHREVGGDLADVLDNVAGTIRERGQVRRQVKALTAEGRLSAWILLALPFGVAGFMTVTNPEYLAVLFETGIGRGMLAIGGLLMAAGALWLRKIVQVVF